MSDTQSPYQMIRAIYDETGFRLHLKPLEEIIKVVRKDENTIVVLMSIVDAWETSRQYHVRRTGKRMISITYSEDDSTGWWSWDELDIWDQPDDSAFIMKKGFYETAAQRRDREEWESLCHRPGTSRTPLDNADRTFQGTIESPVPNNKKMERHWKI